MSNDDRSSADIAEQTFARFERAALYTHNMAQEARIALVEASIRAHVTIRERFTSHNAIVFDVLAPRSDDAIALVTFLIERRARGYHHTLSVVIREDEHVKAVEYLIDDALALISARHEQTETGTA
jgi:hypothetical protein